MDVQALRTSLLSIFGHAMIIAQENNTDSSTDSSLALPSIYNARFKKIVVAAFSRVESELKVLMSPLVPPAPFVQLFFTLFPEEHSWPALQRLLDLKGIKKADQGVILTAFQQEVNRQQSK